METIRLADGATMDLIQVCPGTFTMGASGLAEQRGDERPAHPVLVNGFRIARTETTRAQLAALRDADRATGDPDRGELPADAISPRSLPRWSAGSAIRSIAEPW